MATRWPDDEQELEQIRTAFLTNKMVDHEYAAAMPQQSQIEYRELRKSIAVHGYDTGQPIVVWKVGRKWTVLDGRHRRNAAREVVGALHMGERADDDLAEDLREAGELEHDEVMPSWMVFEGTADEALDLVELRNLQGRRNFPSADAKALAAIHLYELRMRDGKAKTQPQSEPDTQDSAASFILTHPDTDEATKPDAEESKEARPKKGSRIRDEIAEQIQVPPTTVARARRVKVQAAEVLGEERAREIEEGVFAGTLKLSTAEREIKRTKEAKAREARRAELLEQQQQALVDDRLTVMCLDVVEALRQMPDNSIAVAIGDGPYNLDKGEWDRFHSLPSLAKWCREWLAEIERVLAPGGQLFLTGTRHVHPTLGVLLQGSGVLQVESDIVWRKTNATPRATPGLQDDHELVWWAYKIRRRFTDTGRTSATWEGPTVSRSEREFGAHSCQKPGWLIDAMLEMVDAGPEDTVLDLFAGSGTTTERAIRRGCRVIAIDSDPQWKPVIEARAAAAAARSVPTGTDQRDRDPSEVETGVAYVLAAVDGGCRSRAAITAALASEGVITQPIDIDEAFERGLLVETDEGISLTDKGATAVARLAEELRAEEPEHGNADAFEQASQQTVADLLQEYPGEAADSLLLLGIEHVAFAVCDYFAFVEVAPARRTDAYYEIEADHHDTVDGLICGLRDCITGDGDDTADAWSRAYRVGQWLSRSVDVARLLELGLAQTFAPPFPAEEMRQHWNTHASTIGRDDLQIGDDDETDPDQRALAFAAGFFSRWLESNAWLDSPELLVGPEVGRAAAASWDGAAEWTAKAKAIAASLVDKPPASSDTPAASEEAEAAPAKSKKKTRTQTKKKTRARKKAAPKPGERVTA